MSDFKRHKENGSTSPARRIQPESENNKSLPLWKRFIYGVIVANVFHYCLGMLVWWGILSSSSGNNTSSSPNYGSGIAILLGIGALIVAFYIVLAVGLIGSVAAAFRPHKTRIAAFLGGIRTILFAYLVIGIVLGAFVAFATAK